MEKKRLSKPLLVAIVAFVIILIVAASAFISNTLCTVDGCWEKKLEGFEFCEKHKCDDSSCIAQKLENADYCIAHKCKTKDCGNYVDDSTYCEDHECAGPCSEERVDGKKYCKDHLDCFKKGCSKAKYGGSSYCKTHKCATAKCKEQAVSGNYCNDHNCNYPNCEREGKYGASYSKHCSEHGCRISGCDSTRKKGSSLCSMHKKQAEERERNEKYRDKKEIDTGEKQIWKVYVKDGYFKMDGQYRGDGNFIVQISDSNQNLVEVLCNEIGDYNINKRVELENGYYYLEIYASYGTWTASWWGTYGN